MASRFLLSSALALLCACSKAPTSSEGLAEGPPADAPAEVAVPAAEVAAGEASDMVAAGAFFGLVTRDHEIWMHAGPRYTVKQKDGTVLASQIDQAQLEKDYPDLADDLSRMVDVDGGKTRIGVGY